MNIKELGTLGERITAEYLSSQGYSIRQMNFKCRTGEIDIIAVKSGIIAFVEVKLRHSNSLAPAAEYVGYSKQRRIMSAAMYYLSTHHVSLQPRFDVAEVYILEDNIQNPVINYYEDAFQ